MNEPKYGSVEHYTKFLLDCNYTNRSDLNSYFIGAMRATLVKEKAPFPGSKFHTPSAVLERARNFSEAYENVIIRWEEYQNAK